MSGSSATVVASEERASKRAAGHGVATDLGLPGHLGDRVKRGYNACDRDSSARCVSQQAWAWAWAWAQAAAWASSVEEGVCGHEGLLCIPFTMGKAPFLRTGEWRPMATVLLTVVTCGLA